MNTYEVTLLIDASIGVDVEANSPEEAVEKAENESGSVSLCHQCSRELQTGDCYGAIVYVDGKEVADTTRNGTLKAENATLRTRITELEAKLEQCMAKSPVHLFGGPAS